MAGRPTKYKPEYADWAGRLCKIGASDEQIAQFFEIDLAELALWAWNSEEFFNAITPSVELREQWAAEKNKRREKRSAARRAHKAQNPAARLVESTRARIWQALKGQSGGTLFGRLGYTKDDLVRHLESRFAPGMTWANYGQWHIDHIRPCASFDFTDEAQVVACWALSNLQPLWASDNVRKGAKWQPATN